MKNKAKILFIPFWAMCPEHRSAASARFRAEWPAKYIGADMMQTTSVYSDLYNYDLVVFQKAYNIRFLEIAKELKRLRIKTALDLCDAEWLQREIEIKAMIDVVDFITVSTQAIKDWVQNEFPGKNCYVIPDGHDLEYYKPGEPVKQKCGPVKYVWYGNSGTIISLRAIIGLVEQLAGKGDTLTVIADERARNAITSARIGVKFIPWKLETVNKEIKKCNLALNPRLDNESYRVKSNNKTAMAYILGLPCIDRLITDDDGWFDDLINFKLAEKRARDEEKKRHYFIKNFCMEKVAEIWKKTLCKELKK